MKMSSEQMQHLYELLDHTQVEEQVLDGLRRLLHLLRQQVYSYSWYSRYYPANVLWEAKQQLHEVRAILSALALPAHYQGSPYRHVSDAFHAVDRLLQGFTFRQQSAIAGYIKSASGTSTQQAKGASFSAKPSDTSSSDALEKPTTASQADRSPIPGFPRSPYLKFMNQLDAELGAKAAKMKKDEVRDYIKQRWDADTLGDPSARLLDVMATLMRPPEAQKGGAKPKP
jgi:hypothetical protein